MERSAITAALLSPPGQTAMAAGDVGTIMRIARQALGWNQQELARRSGYSQPTISRLERGVGRVVRDLTVLTDVASTLGVPVSALGMVPQGAGPPTLDDVDRRTFRDDPRRLIPARPRAGGEQQKKDHPARTGG